jgi:hypothetical protein
MLRDSVLVIAAVAVLGCAETPTQARLENAVPTTPDSSGHSAIKGLGNVAVLLAPPNFSSGSCLFVASDQDLDGSIQTMSDGSQSLSVNDQHGVIYVTPLGGDTWVGTGTATINWPGYTNGGAAADVDMQVSGDISLDGQSAQANCHYVVTAGAKIQETLTIY